jgi:FixJ family two-component response regulator
MDGSTVYIVDDDASVCRSLERLMRSFGYRPACFHSVDEFLQVQVLASSSCVIADVTMPGRSGVELAETLRRRGNNVPVILVTAHDTEEVRVAAKHCGATAYFRKPVDDQALKDSIEWALSAK